MAEGTLRNLGKKGPPKVKLGGMVYYRPEAVGEWLKRQEK
jgi:predicted DNA-binding transcriptional regulator AlpA